MNQRNDKGQKHGPWETYYSNGDLDIRNQYLNGLAHGPSESYWSNGRLYYKAEWRMNNKIGFWEIFGDCGKSWGKRFYL